MKRNLYKIGIWLHFIQLSCNPTKWSLILLMFTLPKQWRAIIISRFKNPKSSLLFCKNTGQDFDSLFWFEFGLVIILSMNQIGLYLKSFVIRSCFLITSLDIFGCVDLLAVPCWSFVSSWPWMPLHCLSLPLQLRDTLP